MKKMILSLLVITSMIACESKTEKPASAIPSNAVGYDLDSSENINIAKKAIEAGINADSVTFRSIYVDTAAIFDNKNKQTIFESLKMAPFFKSKGVIMKLENINVIWESVNFKADDLGVTNYVHAYLDASLTKETKKVMVGINAVFAFKNGKIVREWDTYDTAQLMELLK
jgi:hypothetical protein